MSARARPIFAATGDLTVLAFAGLVLLAFLLTVAPVQADSRGPSPDSPRPQEVSQTLDRLSKGRVTTLGQIAAQAKWRSSTAKRLSKAIAAIEADTQAPRALSPQTAEKTTDTE